MRSSMRGESAPHYCILYRYNSSTVLYSITAEGILYNLMVPNIYAKTLAGGGSWAATGIATGAAKATGAATTVTAAGLGRTAMTLK